MVLALDRDPQKERFGFMISTYRGIASTGTSTIKCSKIISQVYAVRSIALTEKEV